MADVIPDLQEMRRCLNRLVQSEIFDKIYCPPKSNKRFYSRLKIIRSHMVKLIKKIAIFKDRPRMFDKKDRAVEDRLA